MLLDSISKDDLTIKVHHVGGIGNCGPTEAIGKLGKDVQWIIYDADQNALSKVTKGNKQCLIVNRCIGGSKSKGKFYITQGKSASSTLKSAASAAKCTFKTRKGKGQIWGEHTRVIQTVDIETTTLDLLADSREVPLTDFLSIDAQGAELDIINGASKMLKSSIIGLVCEVPFAEIYAGQALFCDIQDRLRKEGFRLCEIYNRQYWNTAPYAERLLGSGFYVVGEALFLKDPNAIMNMNGVASTDLAGVKQIGIQCLKLAAVAIVFDQLDFALGILRKLQESKWVSLGKLAEEANVNYIKLLRDLSHVADMIEANKPSLVHESSCLDDRDLKRSEKIVNTLVVQTNRLLGLVAPPILYRLIRRVIMMMDRDYFAINKIYRNYGIHSKIYRNYGIHI